MKIFRKKDVGITRETKINKKTAGEMPTE